MSVSDIEEQIREVYDYGSIFFNHISITSAITNEVVTRQNRPLEDLYLIVWMDGIVFKVRENSKVINKTIYLAVGLNRNGKSTWRYWLGKIEKVVVFG